MPLALGQIVKDRYRVDGLLGQGGFGAVYKAWDLQAGTPCALKENGETTREAQRQFEREARLLSALQHPNLPTVTDYFVIPGQGQYLVMEYVEGEDLQALLDRANGPLPEPAVLAWIAQVCDALSYMHGQSPPVIHRDIKPANIRITPGGQAVLVDFGIAKLFSPGLTTTIAARAVTPGYSPPEQYGHGTTDPRSDVHAVGAALYTALTGQKPTESVLRTIGAPLPAPRDLNPAISAASDAAILRALELVPEARFQSVAELLQALPEHPALAEVPALDGAPGPRHVLPTRRAGRRGPWPWARLAAGAAVLLGAGAILWLALGSGLPVPAPTATATAPPLTRAATVTPLPATATPRPTATATASKTPLPTATRTPSPTSAPPTATPVLDIGADGMVLVQIPAGDFLMGSPAGEGADDEWPQHTVSLDAFWIDRTEVTNALYARCVAAGACPLPADTTSSTRPAYFGAAEFDGYPVIRVTWDMAQVYCTWAGRRLPTEAEWEKAARGVEGWTYPWGNSDRPVTDGLLNFCDRNCSLDWRYTRVDDGYADTAPVGSYFGGASPQGVFDMAGNVGEWVADWYAGDYFGRSPQANPPGPEAGELRVVRGSNWASPGWQLRIAYRGKDNPANPRDDRGFRCAR